MKNLEFKKMFRQKALKAGSLMLVAALMLGGGMTYYDAQNPVPELVTFVDTEGSCSRSKFLTNSLIFFDKNIAGKTGIIQSFLLYYFLMESGGKSALSVMLWLTHSALFFSFGFAPTIRRMHSKISSSVCPFSVIHSIISLIVLFSMSSMLTPFPACPVIKLIS